MPQSTGRHAKNASRSLWPTTRHCKHFVHSYLADKLIRCRTGVSNRNRSIDPSLGSHEWSKSSQQILSYDQLWAASQIGRNAVTWHSSLSNAERVTVDGSTLQQRSSKKQTKQDCVEPRTSALNMTLPADRAPADIDRQPVRGAGSCRSIYAACARTQWQTSRTSLLLSINGTDERTDIRLLHTPCAAYYATKIRDVYVTYDFIGVSVQKDD